jgi:hypothetical protein
MKEAVGWHPQRCSQAIQQFTETKFLFLLQIFRRVCIIVKSFMSVFLHETTRLQVDVFS